MMKANEIKKVYQIHLIFRREEEGNSEEREWATTILARDEHTARRLIVQKVLSWGALVSHFLQVERCT